jgi:outer membrane receptor protein involved in Fe transport
MIRRVSFLILAMLFIVSVCFGQAGQTGSIIGTVTDPDGVELAGVTVIIKSPALVLPQMTTVTNVRGIYRFLNLNPGTYQLTFMLEGMMNTIVRDGIQVRTNATSTINVQMQSKTISEEVVVKGQSPTIDSQSTTKTANIDSDLLFSIPSTRSVSDYFNMTPGVFDDTAFGSSTRDNAYQVDGVNLNDPVIGTQGVFLNTDIMEEMSIQTGGISAEYGGASGAVINVVTKSGGNKFSGSASVFYNHNSFQSDNTKGTPLEGSSAGDDYRFEPTLSLGGPVVKDKLWFFGSMSMVKTALLTAGFPYDKDSEVPDTTTQYFPYIKFTYQPDQNNKIVLSYQYTDRLRTNRGASYDRTENQTWDQKSPNHVVNAQWSKTFGTDLYANLKASMVKGGFNTFAHVKEPWSYDYVTGLYGAYEQGAGSDRRNVRDRYQFNADATAFVDNFAGVHEFKFGAEYMIGYNQWIINMFGDPAADHAVNMSRTYYFGPYYAIWRLPLNQEQRTFKFSLFLQDNWNVTKNLTFTLGARYEAQKGTIPKQNTQEAPFFFLPQFYGDQIPVDRRVLETMDVVDWNNISPRLGLIYDLFSDGKTLFKATWAKLYTELNVQWYNGLNPNAQGIYYGPWDPENPSEVLVPWGVIVPAPNTLGYGNYDFKAPSTEEYTVGIEHELFENWSISARFIKKFGRNLVEDVNASSLDIDALMNGELVWKNYEQVYGTDPFNGQQLEFWNRLQNIPSDFYSLNPPQANREYTGFEFILNKRFSNGYAFMASYVYSKTEGLISTEFGATNGLTGFFNEPNAHVNAIGRLPGERRHQFKIIGTVKGPLGINLSTNMQLFSGRRYTRTVRSADIGVNLSQGAQTNFAETRGSRGLPSLAILDFKLEKVFSFSTFKISIFGDVFNALNQGKATSVWTRSSGGGFDFEEMLAINPPRLFRIGAKIDF